MFMIFELAIGLRPPKRCCHPNHAILLSKKSPTVQTVQYKVVMLVLQDVHQTLIGAKFCENNEKKMNAKTGPPHAPGKIQQTCMEHDVCFVPHVPYINSSDLESPLLIIESFPAKLETSQLLFQIRKKASDLSEGTKLKFKQKFLRTQETLKKKFAEAVAPGRTEECIDDVLTENTNEEESSVPGDMQHVQ